MPYSPVDLYRDILPKTNCGDCGFSTCVAFAAKVVAEHLPLSQCPHLDPDGIADVQKALDAQYDSGKWRKRDMAEDALQWARQRAASMQIKDLEPRIGGRTVEREGRTVLLLPYFQDHVIISSGGMEKENGEDLSRLEQTFLYNHMAQGGISRPTGKWTGFQEFPNTVSKIKSMREHVEKPLADRFSGRATELKNICEQAGALDVSDTFGSSGMKFRFAPLPRLPVLLSFQDADEEFDAECRLLFDETATEHLDIESILFLSERLKDLLVKGTALN